MKNIYKEFYTNDSDFASYPSSVRDLITHEDDWHRGGHGIEWEISKTLDAIAGITELLINKGVITEREFLGAIGLGRDFRVEGELTFKVRRHKKDGFEVYSEKVSTVDHKVICEREVVATAPDYATAYALQEKFQNGGT